MVVVKQRRMSGEVGQGSAFLAQLTRSWRRRCKLQVATESFPRFLFRFPFFFLLLFFRAQTTSNCFRQKEQFATESFARTMLIGGAVAVRVQVFWPKIVLKKWLNLKSKDLDFGADEDEDDDGSDIDDQGWSNLPLH